MREPTFHSPRVTNLIQCFTTISRISPINTHCKQNNSTIRESKLSLLSVKIPHSKRTSKTRWTHSMLSKQTIKMYRECKDPTLLRVERLGLWDDSNIKLLKAIITTLPLCLWLPLTSSIKTIMSLSTLDPLYPSLMKTDPITCRFSKIPLPQ